MVCLLIALDDRGRMTAEGEEPTVWIDGIFQDITERKTLEEQFRQSQKMEAVGQLAGGVAHDFNNLLQIIMGHADLLEEQLDGKPDAISDLRIIRSASGKATGLVQQLLAFGRRQIIRLESHDINKVVSHSLKMLQRTMPRRIDLRFDAGKNLPSVLLDLGQADQVIVNLALNARDAMPEGGVLHLTTRLTTVGEDEQATVEGPKPGDYVTLTVSDSGVGMDERTMLQVFEPFFTTKHVGEGSGLGLSTVYGIVKQHDGAVTMESAEGKGTSFTVYLPVAE
jgi:two-component system, cell cycle sensor histidine kinase and response regulator CckA